MAQVTYQLATYTIQIGMNQEQPAGKQLLHGHMHMPSRLGEVPAYKYKQPAPKNTISTLVAKATKIGEGPNQNL